MSAEPLLREELSRQSSQRGMRIVRSESDLFEDAFEQELAALVKERPKHDGQPWWAVQRPERRRAEQTRHEVIASRQVIGRPAMPPTPQPSTSAQRADRQFVPLAPTTLAESGLTESMVEGLVLKYLLNRGLASGREIANQLKLPFRVLEGQLLQIKKDQMVVYKAEAPLSDYVYELTDVGCDRARRYAQFCTYYGAAPVSLDDYVASVAAQSVRQQSLKLADLQSAFGDMLLASDLVSQLGQSISSGLGMLLYGAPGNGKTSIAERVTRAMGTSIWIPRAVFVCGELIRLFDPSNHEALPDESDESPDEARQIDRRWVRIRRPTIVVGGELTMDVLEVTHNRGTGISEAPLQMKSNGGTLVIDDLGRQRMRPADLLNRWIVPLEKRYDFLNLSSGRKICVPFDQLIVFCTNLEPRDLVDEAFLRRIAYKILVEGPSEADFRTLFNRVAAEMGMECEPGVVDYLVRQHYQAAGRTMRSCHPRDLLRQIRTYCAFHEMPPRATAPAIDAAVRNYFAAL